jgi:hypothetical protein
MPCTGTQANLQPPQSSHLPRVLYVPPYETAPCRSEGAMWLRLVEGAHVTLSRSCCRASLGPPRDASSSTRTASLACNHDGQRAGECRQSPQKRSTLAWSAAAAKAAAATMHEVHGACFERAAAVGSAPAEAGCAARGGHPGGWPPAPPAAAPPWRGVL